MSSAAQVLPTTAAGWRRFYLDMNQFDTLPRVMDEVKIGVDVYNRDLILDLSTIKVQDGSRVRAFAFGDVVTLSSERTFDLSTKPGFLFVVGRTFSTDSPCQLQFKVSHYEAQIVLYIAMLQQPLTVTFTDDKNRLESVTLDPDGKGKSIAIICKNRIVRQEGVDRLPDAVFRTDIPQKFIKSQLRIASLTRFAHPTLSSTILLFVRRLTSMTRVASTPHLEALAMLRQLNNDRQYEANGNVCFVPTVSISVVENTLGKLLDAASAYYDEYRLFITSQDPHDRDQVTRKLAGRINDSVAMQRQQSLQAKSRWEHAQEALRTASRQAAEIDVVVQKLRESFASSLEEWAKEEGRRILTKTVLSVFCFAISLASLVAGNPAGIAQSPEQINAIFDFKDNIVEIDEVATQLAELKHGIHVIRETVSSLNESMTDAKRSIETISNLHCGNPSEIKNNKNDALPFSDPEATNALAALEALIIHVRNALNTAIEKGIDKAQDYLSALEQQTTYGKAQCRTAAAVAKAGQDYAQAFLQLHILERQCDESRKRMDDLEAEKASFEDKSVVFFDRLLSMKAVIVTELGNYKNSFKFSTLRDSSVVLDAKRTVPQLMQDFASIKLELESYLATHSSGPQPFVLPMTLTELPVNPVEVISRLRSGDHQFTITLERVQCGSFTDFFMVRLRGLRLWLVGAKSRDTRAVVKIRLQTSGLYKDFDNNSRSFTFSTAPLDRKFYYELVGFSQGITLYDSIFTEEKYISPTPFTEWTITLLNPGDLDLSGLTGINIQWEGHAYAV